MPFTGPIHRYNRPMQAVIFRNFSNEDFTYSWDSIPYTFRANSEMYMEDWKAKHFAKHLVDREMMKDKIQIDDQRRGDYLAKCLISEDVQVETEESKVEMEILNLNKKKIGRPKKVKEEEVFEGLK